MNIIILSLAVFVGVQSESESLDIDDIEDYSAFVASQPLRYIERVLICTNKDALEQIMPHRLNMFSLFSNIDIEFLDVKNCHREIESDRYVEKSILAVIAPKPFKNISDSEVPIYFYDAPYFLEDVGTPHCNDVSALIDWRPLKHAFTHFFEQQGWIRIAIVSDDSPYSAAFEEEFVGHLHEKGLVYNVQRCVKTLLFDCDFHEALNFIKQNNAFIVVANVDPNNALALVKQARGLRVTRKQRFVWLSRDWPFGDVAKDEIDVLGPIVSLTLAPLVEERISSQLHIKSLDGPHLASILQGLALVDDAVRHTERNRIDHFYRDIAKHMNEAIKRDTCDTQAFIRQIGPNSNAKSSKVITVVVANSRFITSYNIINDFGPKVYDVKDCSIMRSNVFTDPCNDLWISLIVLMVLIFILLFFLIIYVYIRYFAYFVESSMRKRNWSVL